MNLEKFYRIEAQHDEMAARRRARGETYRERLARSKNLRDEATWKAHPDVQAMSLANLLKLTDEELAAVDVDVVLLRRAGFERRSADGVLRDPVEEQRFADTSALLANLRAYVGTLA